MNFDGLTLYKVVQNLKKELIGKRLNNVYNTLKSEYDFKVRDKTLLVSISPNNGRIYFTNFVKENPLQPSNFTMVMRKYIKKSIILDVKTLGYDRVVKIDFKGRGELGEERIISLYVELMGKYSNLILVDGDKIIDSHRRIVTRFRKVLPNKDYVPFVSDKVHFDYYFDKEAFFKDFDKSQNIEKALVYNIQGMSPKVAKFIVSGFDDIELVYERYCDLMKDFEKREGLYFTDKQVYPIKFPNTFYSEEISEDLEKLYINIEKDEINRNKKHKYFLKIKDEIAKLNRDIDNLKNDLSETKNYDIYRKYGELLQIYQSTITSQRPVLEDYETNEMIEVPLLERKNALQSSLAYFKKYNKFKRRREILSKRIKLLTQRLKHANEILLHIDLASNDEDLKELEMEFKDFGITFKAKHKKSKKKATPKSKPKEYIINNCKLYVGKNSFQNEKLYRSSPKDSLWLHAKAIPSSHGILIGDYDESILKTAAEIIAYHSKSRLSSKVQIDYTKLSNVYKPKGAAKGFVLYKNFKTVVVNPNEHTELLY